MRENNVISITNAKGGVGKTTTALNLGAALHEKGHSVLLIDNDHQGNLTAALGYTPGEQKQTLAKRKGWRGRTVWRLISRVFSPHRVFHQGCRGTYGRTKHSGLRTEEPCRHILPQFSGGGVATCLKRICPLYC